MQTNIRSIAHVFDSQSLLEGGGFPVRRPFPVAGLSQIDPFLLLDEMGPVNWEAGQAIGAPAHPHRGFETVTYLLQGEMEHRDSAGHVGKLGAGDVQWMTAGSGVVHSELPSAAFQAQGGVMHGFQLWVNLPASNKMMAPRYQEIPASDLPVALSKDGKTRVRVIAGEALGVSALIDTVIPITYLHCTLQPGGTVELRVPATRAAFGYVFSGALHAEHGRVEEGQVINWAQDADVIRLDHDCEAGHDVELLLLAGEPLDEPVVRHGPFVMNTREQINQAIDDHANGRLGDAVDPV